MNYNGKFYLKYYPHVPAVIELGTDIVAAVQVRNDVALVQLDTNQYIPMLMARTCGCCNEEKRCFSNPSIPEIERWLK